MKVTVHPVRWGSRGISWIVTKTTRTKTAPFVMYDAIEVAQIPRTAVAVAGYVGGNWPTFPDLERDFPHAKRLSIAVNAAEDADCLDIENGDATPEQAAGWVKRQLARGIKRPCVYCSIANAAQVLKLLKAAGISRGQVRVFTAHYTGHAHRCSPLCRFGFWTRADATQWLSTSSVDVSLCAPDFL